MESKRLDNAALAAGISPNYINAHGKPQSIGAETKRRLLDAMHRTTAATQVAVTPVPNVMVYTAGKKMPLAVEGSGEFNWLLTTEEGVQHKGHAVGGKSFNLPAKLPEGYHTLTLTQDDRRFHCRVIVAPKRCYEPQALLEGKKLWGACVQLYTLRSDSNWGIGDFGDLKKMLVDVGERGGAFIGLNPIHALYPANPESASPYSPSSRRWLNVIYIDVNALDDFKNSKEAQAWWKLSTTQQALKLRETERVLRHLMNDMPIGLCMVDEAHRIYFRNRRFLEDFGHTEAETPTLHEWTLRAYPEDDYRRVVGRTWKQAMALRVSQAQSIVDTVRVGAEMYRLGLREAA